nr:hypothetical protein CFP56_78669 [Quercus suber]
MTKNRELSREEEVELSRSKKKVKGHHANFNNVLSKSGHSQGGQTPWGDAKKTFKDKLVGEIPGAYAKAFDFSDLMDMKAESDKEVEELREGLAAMKLTRDTKLRIRKPWSKALIIKLYGRAIGLGALQSKLNMLWKPVGSLDCVDLGKEFYSVRFLLKEDMDAVLKNGPWFIVRLHALPMELYEAEVLKQIGEAIGKERTSNVSSVVPLGRTRMVSSATEDGRGKRGLAVARPPLIRDRRAKHP